MRQPFEYRHGPRPNVDSDILQDFPEHARKIAAITAHWNLLAASMFVLFTVLLAGQDEAAFAIYYAVLERRENERRKAFKEIAMAKQLSKDTLKDLDTLWRDIEKVAVHRNDVVHAVWASIEGHRNAIFALRSWREWAENVNAMITVNQARAKTLTTYMPKKDLATITKFWKYKLGDLQEIIDMIVALVPRVQEMHNIVGSQVFSHRASQPWKKAEDTLEQLYQRQHPKDARQRRRPNRD
jgi:hypothetical protein